MIKKLTLSDVCRHIPEGFSEIRIPTAYAIYFSFVGWRVYTYIPSAEDIAAGNDELEEKSRLLDASFALLHNIHYKIHDSIR